MAYHDLFRYRIMASYVVTRNKLTNICNQQFPRLINRSKQFACAPAKRISPCKSGLGRTNDLSSLLQGHGEASCGICSKSHLYTSCGKPPEWCGAPRPHTILACFHHRHPDPPKAGSFLRVLGNAVRPCTHVARN